MLNRVAPANVDWIYHVFGACPILRIGETYVIWLKSKEKSGPPGRIRTADLWFRRTVERFDAF